MSGNDIWLGQDIQEDALHNEFGEENNRIYYIFGRPEEQQRTIQQLLTIGRKLSSLPIAIGNEFLEPCDTISQDELFHLGRLHLKS
eukprot:7578290-Heterocapsa_arctica.AAC.1